MQTTAPHPFPVRMSRVPTMALGLQGALLVYLQVIEWIDLYPWNDIRRGNGQEVLDLALGVLMLLALWTTWRRWWPGMLMATIGYSAWLYLQIATFWIPYAFGASPRWQRIHAAHFSETIQWLPRWGTHLPPDASHFLLQLLLIAALVAVALETRRAVQDRHRLPA